MRRVGLYIPLIIIYLCGALVLLGFFTKGFLDNIASLLSLWVSIIIGFALLLGLINVLRVHFARVRQGGSNSYL